MINKMNSKHVKNINKLKGKVFPTLLKDIKYLLLVFVVPTCHFNLRD